MSIPRAAHGAAIVFFSAALRPLCAMVPLALAVLSGHAIGQVQLVSPNGGQTLLSGDPLAIRWTATQAQEVLGWSLWYSTRGTSGPWLPIARHRPGGSVAAGSTHQFSWRVPYTATQVARVRVAMDTADADWFDVSDADFAIASTLNGDCNGNGIPDEEEIRTGLVADVDANGIPDECEMLSEDRAELPVTGGRVSFTLDAGPAHADAYYVLLGSLGTSPGIPLAPSVTLPLNPGPYFSFTTALANSSVLPNSVGLLDSSGRATSALEFPACSLSPAAIGLTLYHAFAVFEFGSGFTNASNAVGVSLVQPAGYWARASRAMATSPNGNVAAISRHNCYSIASGSSATNLADTLDMIHAAQAAGADVIELDVKEEAGLIRVDHNDNGSAAGAPLSLVLVDSQLSSGDQILFIEIKEDDNPAGFVQALLDMLRANGYGVACRPVVLRAFHSRRQYLHDVRNLLATTHAAMRDHVMLNELFLRAEVANPTMFQSRFDQAAADGWHGVEVDYRSPNLFGMLKYASHLGLGTGIYTVPATFGEVFVANAREDVDFITTDYPADKARAVVEDDNALIYLNVWDQPDPSEIVYRRDGLLYPLSLTDPNRPALQRSPAGEDFHGHFLDFVATQQDYLRFFDADNNGVDGFFVTAVVNFDVWALSDGDTAVLLGKADSAGFSLELYNPPGSQGTILRFGVRVGGAYRYATYPASNLNGTDNYLITAAYDGNGRVRMWVDNKDTGVTTAGPFAGGVEQNDSDVLGGADPQGAAGTRFFVDAKIQQLSVQKWANH